MSTFDEVRNILNGLKIGKLSIQILNSDNGEYNDSDDDSDTDTRNLKDDDIDEYPIRLKITKNDMEQRGFLKMKPNALVKDVIHRVFGDYNAIFVYGRRIIDHSEHLQDCMGNPRPNRVYKVDLFSQKSNKSPLSF